MLGYSPFRVRGLSIPEDDAGGHLLPHAVPGDLIEPQPVSMALFNT